MQNGGTVEVRVLLHASIDTFDTHYCRTRLQRYANRRICVCALRQWGVNPVNLGCRQFDDAETTARVERVLAYG